jgi:hypothetical protein
MSSLEASQADYRAVLAAVNALGVNQREQAERLGRVESDVVDMKVELTDTNTRVRSLEDTSSEIKELLIRALDL